MFDISKQDYSKFAEAGHKFELKLPDGSNSGAYLIVIGDLSPAVKAFGRRSFEEYRQREATAKRKGKEYEITLEEAEEKAVEASLVRLVGWEGILEDGKTVEFSKDKAREFLTKHSWVREQVLNEAADVTNFTQKTQSN